MSSSPLLRLGLPEGAVAATALLLGLVCLGVRAPGAAWLRRQRWALLLGLAVSAALASFGYFQHYLGGAPRIIDATAYLLEGRLLEHGQFTFPVPEPSALFRGRFLISAPELPLRLGVIFPPGYPLLLAAGERLGSYRLVGPSLAALLVLLTCALAWAMTRSWKVALAAAAFSVSSACLRYHTADTMSHGLSALLATSLVLSSLSLSERSTFPSALGRHAVSLVAGLCTGWLICTRQLTGAVFALVCWGFVAKSGALAVRSWAFALLGAAPGVLLLLAQHHALTGDFWTSPQLRYYALSDGPPDCFGLGWGKGCQFEHPEVVQRQGGGLGPFWALRNTLNRLHAHSMDVANLEPLALIGPWWLLRRRQRVASRLLGSLLVGLPFAYAFFYFDGDFPGGGARFLSELLPLEHVALAAGLAELRLVRWGLALSLFGFAFHASFSHAFLRDHFEASAPALPREPRAGLVFVESDHDFLSHFEPEAVADPLGHGRSSPLVARRGDPRRERYLWEARGRPSTFRLARGRSPATLFPWQPATADAAGAPIVLQVEGEWPVLEQHGLWAHPSYPPGSCVSNGRSLLLHPAPPDAQAWLSTTRVSVTIDARDVPAGRYRASAFYWSTKTGCFSEELPPQSLPGSIEVRRVRPLHAPEHLDRLELTLSP